MYRPCVQWLCGAHSQDVLRPTLLDNIPALALYSYVLFFLAESKTRTFCLFKNQANKQEPELSPLLL